MKFYNRKKELKVLENVYKSAKVKMQTVVIHGRRRIGKTELVKQFATKHSKNSFYLFVEIKDEQITLNDMEEVFSDKLDFTPRFNNWEDFFAFLGKYKKEDPMVIIFDEFQNFSRINKGLFTKFQKYIDELQDEKIMLILIGSYVGLMKKIFMDRKEPLFGRADRIIKLKPFNFFEASKMMKDAGINSLRDRISIYGILDGIPKYLRYLFELDTNDTGKIIKKLFLDPTAPLFEEGKNILVQEFGSEHKGYFSILEAIAAGNTKPGEIANFVSQNGFRKYINELKEKYEVIKRIIPVTRSKNTTKSRYELSDNFYKFWFRYVYKNHTGIEFMPDKVFDRIKKDLPVYEGKIYENICTQYLLENIMADDFVVSKYGRWWSKDDEIDIVIMDKRNKQIIFGECKYRNKKTSKSEIKTLIDRTKKVNWYNSERKEKLYFFSKSGFTQKAIEYCEETGIMRKTML